MSNAFAPEWCNEPPVSLIGGETELKDCLKKFELAMMQVGGNEGERAQNAVKISQLITLNSSARVYAYYLGGAPVAILRCVIAGFSLEICDVATDPRVSNGSDILIEFALCNTKKKKAFLCAENEEAFKAYKAIGFVKEETGGSGNTLEKGQMTLDCASSPDWEITGAGPRRKKYLTFGFAKSDTDPTFTSGKKIPLRLPPL